MDDRAYFLGRVPVFRELPDRELRDLADRFVPVRTARGQRLYAQGAPCAHVHLVVRGRVKVVRETSGGRAVLLRLHGPTDLLDLVQDVHPASAVALDPGEVWRLPKGTVERALPFAARAWAAELERRLREAELRIADLQTEPAERRLARAVLRLARPTVELSRQDLADLTGASLFTTSRTLAAWHRRGWVDARRERITVLDRAAVERAGADDA